MRSAPRKRGHQYRGMDASERIEERRRKFLQAGLEAFGVQGYAHTGIREICRLAGLTERYFYESFEQKEDLLSAVYQMLVVELNGEFQAIASRADTSPREKVAQGIGLFYSKLHADPRRARIQFFEILGVSPRIDSEYLAAASMMTAMIGAITAEAFPQAGMDGPSGWIIATGITGAMIHIAQRWALDGYDTPLDELISQVTNLLIKAGEGLA